MGTMFRHQTGCGGMVSSPTQPTYNQYVNCATGQPSPRARAREMSKHRCQQGVMGVQPRQRSGHAGQADEEVPVRERAPGPVTKRAIGPANKRANSAQTAVALTPWRGRAGPLPSARAPSRHQLHPTANCPPWRVNLPGPEPSAATGTWEGHRRRKGHRNRPTGCRAGCTPGMGCRSPVPSQCVPGPSPRACPMTVGPYTYPPFRSGMWARQCWPLPGERVPPWRQSRPQPRGPAHAPSPIRVPMVGRHQVPAQKLCRNATARGGGERP